MKEESAKKVTKMLKALLNVNWEEERAFRTLAFPQLGATEGGG